MKRYRVLEVSFDNRALAMSQEIHDHWDDAVKERWRQTKRDLEEELRREHGEVGFSRKLEDFLALGPQHFSVLAFHNEFLSQARTAFVAGAYYPALTGCMALGERILNHLVISLRERFRGTPEYKRVHGKGSFDNWNTPIEVLESWGILPPAIADDCKSLYVARHDAIRFRPDLDQDARTPALEAIRLLSTIITALFPWGSDHPRFIPDTPGESYISKEYESDPFTSAIYLPNAHLVGPNHRLRIKDEGAVVRFVVDDPGGYAKTEITDAEFARLRQRHKVG